MERLTKEQLENSNLTLDESVKKFEEGIELSKKCNEMLQQARNTEKQLEEMEVVDQKLNEQLQANLVELERMTNSLTTEIDLDKLKKEIERKAGERIRTTAPN